MKWGLWSTTAASNSNAPPDGAPEGQAPSTLNDCIREMMAQVKVGILDLAQGFIDIGQSPTFVSSTSFTTPTNDLSYMPVGGRLRFNVGSSTLYGTVISASFSTNTFISVAMDSGSLTGSLTSMAIGVRPQVGNHFDGAVSISTNQAYALYLKTNSSFSSIRMDCSGGAKIVRVSSASNLEWVNSANNAVIMTLTDAGALTAAGNITAFSDERLKKNWQPLPFGTIRKVGGLIKSGSFERTDMPGRFYGVGAQSLEEVLPHSTTTLEDGTKAVDYGGTALALCVELCREIGYLNQRIRRLEDKS